MDYLGCLPSYMVRTTEKAEETAVTSFQGILEGIMRHRANPMSTNAPSGNVIASEVERKINEIEWALQALAEALRDREAELSAIAPHERAGHGSDARDEVDVAFEEYAKPDQHENHA